MIKHVFVAATMQIGFFIRANNDVKCCSKLSTNETHFVVLLYKARTT